MNRPGLKRVKKSVRGKRGTALRSYWVKTSSVASKRTATQEGAKTAFKFGLVSGLGQYAAAARMRSEGAHAAWALGSHAILATALRRRKQAAHSFVGAVGQHAVHSLGRLAGQIGGAALHTAADQIAEHLRNTRRKAK